MLPLQHVTLGVLCAHIHSVTVHTPSTPHPQQQESRDAGAVICQSHERTTTKERVSLSRGRSNSASHALGLPDWLTGVSPSEGKAGG
ncbi:hypothetical protein FKM82_014032 [Ascaphus truei]